MWEIHNSSQLIGVLYSIVLGMLFCLVYDLLRAFRKEIKFTAATVFFQDIIYSLFCAIISFIFMLALVCGEIRSYIIFGIGVGFLLSRFTVSRLWIIVLLKFIRFFILTNKVLFAFFRRIFSFLECFFIARSKDLKKICNFFLNTLKKA